MADIHAATSSYSTGTNDTYTALTDDVDEVTAIHQNGPASAIIGIETILGIGTTLKGSAADLATRIGVAHETSGKLKDFASGTKETFPGVVAEGCTGATSFTASQIIRMHASSDVLESTGYTVPGSSGVMVSEGDTQTLTNKTLTTPTITTPTIASFANATHDHADATGGGALGSATVIRATLKTSTGGVSGSSSGDITVSLDPYSFFPAIRATRVGASADIQTVNSATGASADAPEFVIVAGGTNTSYDVDWRYIALS